MRRGVFWTARPVNDWVGRLRAITLTSLLGQDVNNLYLHLKIIPPRQKYCISMLHFDIALEENEFWIRETLAPSCRRLRSCSALCPQI